MSPLLSLRRLAYTTAYVNTINLLPQLDVDYELHVDSFIGLGDSLFPFIVFDR